MADAFNAYRDWLGLPDDAPADHYTLLSLAPFEADHAKISAAAERAATRVRSFRPGPRARDWSRLLDEIQEARHCLLDSTRKAEYDRKLRLGETSPPSMADSPPPAAAAAPSVAPANPDLYPPTAKPASRPRSDLLPPASDVVLATAVDDPFEPPRDDDSSDLPMAYPIHHSPAAPDTYSAAPSAPRSTPKFQAAGGLDPMAPVAIPAISQPEPVPRATFSEPVTVRSQSLSAAHFLVLGIIGASLLVIGVALYIASQRQQLMLRAPTPQAPPLADPSPVPPKPRIASQPIREPSPSPQAIAKGNNALTERPGAHRPAPRAEPVAPAPQPAPPPESPSSVAPQPAPSQVTRAEVIALATALKAARQALGEQDFPQAAAQIAKAESLAKLPQHRDAVARLKEVSGYVEYFRNAIATALGEMQAGESFTVGASTEVAFVEMSKNAALSKNTVTLHVGGMNRTYDLAELPVGLAMAIADLKLADSNPVTRVVKGSYLLVHKRADAELFEKARSWWQEAQARGLDMTHLLPFLTDDYDALLKDVSVKDVPAETEKN